MSSSDTGGGWRWLGRRRSGGKFFPIFPTGLRHAQGVKALLLVILLSGGAASAADSLGIISAAPGQLILTQLVAAPFPHPSRANGHTYKETFFPADKHYSDSTVAFFIPAGYQPKPNANFVIHFHGWRNTVGTTLAQYALPEQLVASGRNAILIVPEGPHDAPDSSGGKLDDPDGFQRFMAETMTALQQRGVLETNVGIGSIILSGHSGGYQVISSIVARGGLTAKVQEVWLFDALYAQSDRFLTWADQTGGRLLDIYTDNGGTKLRSEEMIAALKQQHKFPLVTTDTAVTRAELQTNRFVFLHTDLAHNEVVAKRMTFQMFLETSCLPLRLEQPGEVSRLRPAVPRSSPP